MAIKMHVMEMFPIPVFIFETKELDNKELTRRIYAIRDREQAIGKGINPGHSNLGGYHTHSILHEAGFESLKALIIKVLNQQVLQGRWYVEPGVDERHFSDMWSIINGRGHANSIHNHPYSWFSGVYYTQVPALNHAAGSLTFRDPIAARTFTRTFYRSSQAELCSIAPQEGLLVIFPGWCDHAVLPNNTDEERVAISFNLKMHG